MKRRTSIKSILALSLLGASSFSVYKWFYLHHDFDPAKLASFKELIADLADTIIPETDTPGAKQAGVAQFIINVISNCTPKVEQNKFIYGLRYVEEYTIKNYKKPFSQCNSTERFNILAYFEEQNTYSLKILNKINNKMFGTTFFSKLKELTVQGYCQSELGATQGLNYDEVPVNYEPCIPLQLNQKSWATK
ncbi:gluconate 2-dehydrogenase subunit 3 family protein [Pedobacter aquatilis]|uniref:gluconate 2-dehydrogenase subunit 3 family protein n=1 Tax=Pedobacter aquatilis TaxID=351343 RepID=UPI00292E6C1F|nr:gluconate 2-dehydrogenase subunit 3 family protein [Pedobacter aquatilis]